MTTANQIMETLYPFIATAEIKALITGGVYLEARPDDSQKSDIVIQSQVANNGQIQEIYLQINTYVKNLPGGIPDNDTIDEAEEALIGAIEELDADVFSVMITGVSRYPDRDREGWWYSNIRLYFDVFNPNLKG